jgi:2-methylcitrate dehydratase
VVTEAGADTFAERLCELAMAPPPIPAEALHAAKVRVIDSLASLLAGWESDVAAVVRAMAAAQPATGGATILGTSTCAALEQAVFANAATGRYAELNDTYHVPGKPGAHPSDAIPSLLGIAELEQVSGADFLTAVCVAYEVSLGLVDGCDLGPFDYTNLVSISTVLAGARLMELPRSRTAAALGICATSHNALRRVRTGEISNWKAAASGEAARAAVAALNAAAAGLDGPPRPFEGPFGWRGVIAQGDAELSFPSGTGSSWRVTRSLLKPRGACGTVIPAILAAERAAAAGVDPQQIAEVTVHTYRDAVAKCASDPNQWAPTTRETADHSIPFAVSAALVDGTASTAQFDRQHLQDPLLRSLTASVTVLEDPTYTKRYESQARDHYTRVTVTLTDGRVVTEEVGGEVSEISRGMTDDEVQAKLEHHAAPLLSAAALNSLTTRLWDLEALDDVSALPALLVVARQ